MPNRLEEIRERETKATPGPWRWEDRRRTSGGCYLLSPVSKGIWDCVLDDGSAGGEYPPSLVPEEPDGQFVAHSRQDISYLLRRLEAAEAVIDAYAREVAFDARWAHRRSQDATSVWEKAMQEAGGSDEP